METLPYIYEAHCHLRATPEALQSIYQGYADSEADAIAKGRTTLELGHPDPSKIAPDDPDFLAGSPWGRVVVYFGKFDPSEEYQDISDGVPVADLRHTGDL